MTSTGWARKHSMHEDGGLLGGAERWTWFVANTDMVPQSVATRSDVMLRVIRAGRHVAPPSLQEQGLKTNVPPMAPLRLPTSSGTIASTTLNVPGASVTLARFPPLLRLPSHIHERACLTVLLDGVMAERIRGRERYCDRAAVLIKPGLERHDDVFGRGGSAQIIVEPVDQNEELFTLSSLFAAERFFRDGVAEQVARRLARELEYPDAWTALSAAALTFELVAGIARRGATERKSVKPPAPWLRRTYDLLHNVTLNVPTLAALAREAGVHSAHLARAFRAQYGCSIGTFVRRRRIELAARDLVQPNTTIAAVAAAHGFTDQSHFTRQFRRHTGVTPREYRLRVWSR
jgi:AraC family transcriptional regulator